MLATISDDTCNMLNMQHIMCCMLSMFHVSSQIVVITQIRKDGIIHTPPVMVLEKIKGAATWLKVTITFKKKPYSPPTWTEKTEYLKNKTDMRISKLKALEWHRTIKASQFIRHTNVCSKAYQQQRNHQNLGIISQKIFIYNSYWKGKLFCDGKSWAKQTSSQPSWGIISHTSFKIVKQPISELTVN